MSTAPGFTGIKPRRRRKRRAAVMSSSPSAPVLVSATFTIDDGGVLTLTFDRDVQLVSYDGSAISVVDGPGESRFDGAGGATMSGTTSVVVLTTYADVASGDDVELTASAATGIVSVDGSIAWTGATGLVLPFP
jgi:hypothetical protein